jgi:hypothetical protein
VLAAASWENGKIVDRATQKIALNISARLKNSRKPRNEEK